jgi:hypothetical protein
MKLANIILALACMTGGAAHAQKWQHVVKLKAGGDVIMDVSTFSAGVTNKGLFATPPGARATPPRPSTVTIAVVGTGGFDSRGVASIDVDSCEDGKNKDEIFVGGMMTIKWFSGAAKGTTQHWWTTPIEDTWGVIGFDMCHHTMAALLQRRQAVKDNRTQP